MEGKAYRKISGSFTVNKQAYSGAAVASPEAIYLVLASQRDAVSEGVASLLGVFGLLLVALAGPQGKPQVLPGSVPYGELPPEAREHADWPMRLKPKKHGTPVLVFWREEVDHVGMAKVNNVMWVRSGGIDVRLNLTIGRTGVVRRYLEDAGWEVGVGRPAKGG